MENVYDLYQRGCELLDHGDHQAAIVPLTKARDLEPVMDVVLIANERMLMVERPSHQRKDGVEDREAEGNDRHGDEHGVGDTGGGKKEE